MLIRQKLYDLTYASIFNKKRIMKKTILTISSILIFGNIALGQCNVESDQFYEDNKKFNASWHAKELIHPSDDYNSFEYGFLVAYVQLLLIENPKDTVLMPSLIVRVGAKDKEMVKPRKVKVTFNDGSTMKLEVDSFENSKMVEGGRLLDGSIVLDLEEFKIFYNKSIKTIAIIDHRKDTQILCHPFEDILKEQAKCIVDELDRL